MKKEEKQKEEQAVKRPNWGGTLTMAGVRKRKEKTNKA
jgi:hypothetical protein